MFAQVVVRSSCGIGTARRSVLSLGPADALREFPAEAAPTQRHVAHDGIMRHTADQHDSQIEDHDRGLSFDLTTMITRRRVLLGAAGGSAMLAFLAACGSDSSTSTNATSATTATTATSSDSTGSTTAATTPTSLGPGGVMPAGGPGGAPPGGGAAPGAADSGPTTTDAATGLSAVPEETAGPYPGDGSNGVQVLTASGIVRSNIRSSFGSSTTDAGGVPTTIQITLTDTSTTKPLVGAAVYIWHVDHQGRYSMYTQGATDENYLRGVQESDANGLVTFQSYYPACYDGRWPHIHYEVYPSVASITSAANKIATSQIALPDEVNKVVYAESSYSSSPSIYATVSLATDMVFSDGTTNETPTVTGSVAGGFTIALNVPINA
jgi:protocatechuate 3,4-dioxygenase beta subunit